MMQILMPESTVAFLAPRVTWIRIINLTFRSIVGTTSNLDSHHKPHNSYISCCSWPERPESNTRTKRDRGSLHECGIAYKSEFSWPERPERPERTESKTGTKRDRGSPHELDSLYTVVKLVFGPARNNGLTDKAPLVHRYNTLLFWHKSCYKSQTGRPVGFEHEVDCGKQGR